MFSIHQMIYLLVGEQVGDLCVTDLSSEQTQELIKAICEKTNLAWPRIYDALQTKLRYE